MDKIEENSINDKYTNRILIGAVYDSIINYFQRLERHLNQHVGRLEEAGLIQYL